VSHDTTCGHCGVEYPQDVDHTCDAADAFDRITDLEIQVDNLEATMTAAHEKIGMLVKVLHAAGIEVPEELV
jgi:hypothetical protein